MAYSLRSVARSMLAAAILSGFSASAATAGGFPTLDKLKAGPGRFKPVLGGAAYLDKETGLVWEKEPAASPTNWYSALAQCLNAETGGRFGWRLPMAEELATLLARDGGGMIGLPAGHPFIGATDTFWTSSPGADTFQSAYLVHFTGGAIATPVELEPLTAYPNGRRWCVRGGAGNNPAAQPAP